MDTPTTTRSQLRELNAYVQLLEAPRVQEPDPSHPSIVLLFGWLSAGLPYVRKYVDGLQVLFPTSTIVLVRAYTVWYFTPNRWLEEGVAPVVDIIRREMSNGAEFRGVLVHVLSNGGALQLGSVRRVLEARTVSDEELRDAPPTALVLDSCPAAHELSSAIQSWAPTNRILHLLAIPPITMIYAGFYAANSLAGHRPIFEDMRDTLNQPNLLPSITRVDDCKATPRVYIYSDRDPVTVAADVESHHAEAISAGFDATLERFSGSPHVAHMRSDPERYWGAVSAVWRKALRRSGRGPVQSSL